MYFILDVKHVYLQITRSIIGRKQEQKLNLRCNNITNLPRKSLLYQNPNLKKLNCKLLECSEQLPALILILFLGLFTVRHLFSEVFYTRDGERGHNPPPPLHYTTFSQWPSRWSVVSYLASGRVGPGPGGRGPDGTGPEALVLLNVCGFPQKRLNNMN